MVFAYYERQGIGTEADFSLKGWSVGAVMVGRMARTERNSRGVFSLSFFQRFDTIPANDMEVKLCLLSVDEVRLFLPFRCIAYLLVRRPGLFFGRIKKT